jgi:hypothetical protein
MSSFTLTNLIGIYNYYFVVPCQDLIETKSNGNKLYKFIVNLNEKNEPNNEIKNRYLNKWDNIRWKL